MIFSLSVLSLYLSLCLVNADFQQERGEEAVLECYNLTLKYKDFLQVIKICWILLRETALSFTSDETGLL